MNIHIQSLQCIDVGLLVVTCWHFFVSCFSGFMQLAVISQLSVGLSSVVCRLLLVFSSGCCANVLFVL